MRGHEHGAADDAGLPGGEAEPIHKISDAEGTYGGENFDDGSFHSSHSSSESPRGEHGISLSFGSPVLVDGHVQCPTGTHNFANTDSYTVDVYGSIVGAWLLIVLALLVGIGGAVAYMLCKKRHLSQPPDNTFSDNAPDNASEEPTGDDVQYNADAPADFICPISQCLMIDPVTTVHVKYTTGRRSLLAGQEQDRPGQQSCSDHQKS